MKGTVDEASVVMCRQDRNDLLFGRSLLRSEMQQMEQLLFEEFRGQQELDSGRENRLDGSDN